MSSLQQSPAVGQVAPPPALIDGVSQQQVDAAVKKHVRQKAKQDGEQQSVAVALTEQQFAAYDEAFNALTQMVTNMRITLRLLVGAGHESLSEADAGDLNWMLLKDIESIDDAATALGGFIYRGVAA